ncbi:hypothetical protein EAF04_010818 [Stromatinia cepivora]|nr:hypothetical protein EAF04_010818 [Stromatinia cepivora]
METIHYFLPSPSIPSLNFLVQTITIISFLASLHCFFNRLYFHPLSKIPGPRLAAATFWYEFYYNAIRDGTYIKKFQQMHTAYNSSVIRIAPNHVHVNDPNFYSKIFNNRTAYLKDPGFYKTIGATESFLAITDPQEHRIQRHKVSSLFSTKAVDTMAPRILVIAQKAAQCMITNERQQRPIDMHQLSRSFSADILFEILFDQPQNILGSQEKSPELLQSLDAFLNHLWIIKSFPIIGWLAFNMPQSLAQKVVPGFKSFRNNCEKWVQAAIDRQNFCKATGTHPSSNTIFDLLLAANSDDDYSTRTLPELVDDAFMLVVAGTDSAGNTIANAIYYILADPSISDKLFNELQDNGITSLDSFDCRLVQRLPYLTAVLKETMRIYTLGPGVFPRVVPDGGVTVGGHFLPAGTVISETQFSMHHNPAIFPSPSTFNPERWLGDQAKELEKYLVPFSRGPRACLGMNIAYAQMYIILALLFSRFEMELFETDAESMEWVDHGNAVTRSSVKVRVRRDRWAL